MGTRVLRDPVHNMIPVDDPPWLLRLIETPDFQRLGRIGQLGTSFTTYRGAVHTRFAHSLGVAHVFRRIAARLSQLGEEALSAEEWQVGLAAALLHDIGHAPFSHALESLLSGEEGRKPHEAWTRKILLMEETGISKALREIDPRFPTKVAEVVARTSPLRRVVCLISSQLDADRMDYMLRDSLFAGVEYGRFDLERLVYSFSGFHHGVPVLDGKGRFIAEEYVLARHYMYWQVYYHKTTRVLERTLMLAVERAKELFSTPQLLRRWVPKRLRPFFRVTGPNYGEFIEVDDSDVWCALKDWRDGRDPILRGLCEGVLARRLFKCVAQIGGPYGDGTDPFAFDEAVRSGAIQALIKSRGRSPKYDLVIDYTSDVPYGRFYGGGGDDEQTPIFISTPDGVKPLDRISETVQSVARPVSAATVYVPPELVPDVRHVLRERGVVR